MSDILEFITVMHRALTLYSRGKLMMHPHAIVGSVLCPIRHTSPHFSLLMY